ncbi:T9SS type A sorting domain-containing protein [Adhaeribacter radiodurans]|uniref:T9SS type A sorting domain-containing protein n=1 Tax=Adhaeribacter radiodurans TaxID=2745197 RepID=A0A7L7L7G9_9BACT|nr:T9SS type A sorting domain-containing protein [Adhaeribacter radiodurans]QMU28781.1 T9SS type A sorting domain-containing protein [Adhaeribacter radiodurans]
MWTLSGMGGDKTEAPKGKGADYWVVKLNATGTKVWDKTIGSNQIDVLTSLEQTVDGGYILGGYSSSGVGGDKSEANKGSVNSTDYWIVKLDSSNRLNQNITFNPILDKTYGDAPFALYAKASSDLPITFRVVTGAATLNGNILTLTGPGIITIEALQAGNAIYNPASAIQTFFVELTNPINLWDKTLGGYNPDVLTAMVTTPGGGYLLGGSSESGKSGDKSEASRGGSDYWVVKVDQQGNKLWDKTFGGNDRDELTALIPTADGGYLLGGRSRSGKSGEKSEESRGQNDYWIIKIDGNGQKIWDKTLGGNEYDYLSTLVALPDNSFLLGGSSSSGKNGDKSEPNRGTPNQNGYPATDFWLVKIDAQGAKLWDKTFGGSSSDGLTAIIATPDGGFLLGGSSASDENGDKSQDRRGVEDYWVVRVSENGTKLWDKTFGGITETYQLDNCEGSCLREIGHSVLTTLLLTPDGGYLLGGYSNADKGADKTDSNLGYSIDNADLRDYWEVKIDSKGTKLWDKTYGGIAVEKSDNSTGYFITGNSVLRSMVAAPDGNYLLAGTSDSDKGRDKSEGSKCGEIIEYPAEDGGYYTFFPSAEDYWLVKIDGNGTKKWDKTYGSEDYDELATIIATPEGYVLAGSSAAYGIGGDKSEASRDTTFQYASGKRDYWVIKLKEELPSMVQWEKRYGGSGKDNLTAIIKTSDGGYLSGGYSTSEMSGDKSQASQGKNDYWIVKSDKDGKKLWNKRYGGTDEDYLNTLIQTSDGGYLLGGSSLSGNGGDKTEASRGSRDYWIVKISSTGVKQWDKRFGGSGVEELQKVLQLATGEYILAGMSNSPVSGDKSQASRGEQDYWLMKIDKNGKKLWDKTYGGSLNENLEALALTLDGGFLLGGSSLSGISGDKTQASWGGSDYWIVRVNDKGTKLWDKRFGGAGEDNLMDLGSTRTATGNFFLAGHSTSGAQGDFSQSSQGGKDFWMLKINGEGTKIWDKRFGGSGHEGLRTILLTTDGGYLLAGRSESGISGDKTQPNWGSSDYWIVKTSSTGVKQWDKRFGGSGYEENRMALHTSDGGYLLGGRSDSGVSGDRTQPSQGGTDYWLVKVTPEATSIVAEREAMPLTEPVVEAELHSLTIYPNPAQDQVNIRFIIPQTQTATVQVYDSQGREVATLFQGQAQANQLYQLHWHARNQAAGMYLLRLHTLGKSQISKLLLTR